MCMSRGVSVPVSAVHMESRRGHLIPRVGVIGSCEPSNLGAGNQAQVFYENNMHF